MYTPRYLSQYNQAALLARLEALESEVAALHREPREKRPKIDPVEAQRKVEEEAKRQRERDQALKEAFEREARRDRAIRTPFEEYWERRYGLQPTLGVRFAPGTPSDATVRFPRGVRISDMFVDGEAVRNRAMGSILRNVSSTLTAGSAFREKSGREILADMERAKEIIRNQRAEDSIDCMGYLTRTMFQTLDPNAPSQELRRPLPAKMGDSTGRRADTVLTDDYGNRLTPAEEESIRQSIMDDAIKAKEQK